MRPILLALPVAVATALLAVAAPATATDAASSAPSYTDTVDASGVHQIHLYDGAQPPPISFPNGEAWYRAQVSFTLADGTPRQYRLEAPAGLGSSSPYVLALHALSQGWTGAAAQQDWEALAPSGHFVVVYGVGQPNASWNAGLCCSTAASTDRADSLYLRTVVDLMSAEQPRDPQRLYVTGFSNGAMMAYRFACEYPSLVAAIGVVAGTNESSCTPGEGTGPVAVRHIHGDADTTVPWDGSPDASVCGCVLNPVPQVLRSWAKADHDSGWAEVSATLVPGMGHTWPTGSTYGIDATSDLWAFFQAHPRPAG